MKRDSQFEVLETERGRLKDCETYGFQYNTKLLEALEFILRYVRELEDRVEKRESREESRGESRGESKECLRMRIRPQKHL